VIILYFQAQRSGKRDFAIFNAIHLKGKIVLFSIFIRS
jgi:hypothetical protein